jgi:hypothetical protein
MAKRKIVLLARPGGVLQTEDAAAGAAITPGMLVTLNSSGLVVAHATAAAATARNFAMERDEMGKDMDTAYATGDRVKVACLSQGERVNALIATGQNIGIGALLESAGNGTLRILAAGVPLAQALEAVNNASGSNARLRVQII